MTKHYNPSIVERASRILASKSGDFVSDEVQPNIVLNIPVAPVANIIKAAGSSATGTMTLFTTPSDKDFYITGFKLSMAKDVTNDMATGNVGFSVTVDGVATNPCSIAILTLTAQQVNIVDNLTVPIKVDRNTAITVGANYTAGTMRRYAAVIGYTEEVTR